MEEINIKTLLPVGEKLKPLLSKSCISESDLKGILAERGVFMGDNSKQMSIPLLTLSIISPKEFEKLPYNFGAAIGYSMIEDEIKTIDDAINEATIDMRKDKENYK